MAIAEVNKQDVTYAELNTLTPADLGVKNGMAWLQTLNATAKLLRSRRYTVTPPTRQDASTLLDNELSESQQYMGRLVTRPLVAKLHFPSVLAGAGMVTVFAATYVLYRAKRSDEE
ncbi:hypothetical protein [Sphingomonas sp. Leaf42]|uniref:hypothetical protein n=1 Tax=Sphingomonas sp. Leaf42 TaxID=1736219 RepID=UPI001F17E7BA|nr:hypothetical protein [Sphingomonas sp. Leaf42]